MCTTKVLVLDLWTASFGSCKGRRLLEKMQIGRTAWSRYWYIPLGDLKASRRLNYRKILIRWSTQCLKFIGENNRGYVRLGMNQWHKYLVARQKILKSELTQMSRQLSPAQAAHLSTSWSSSKKDPRVSYLSATQRSSSHHIWKSWNSCHERPEIAFIKLSAVRSSYDFFEFDLHVCRYSHATHNAWYSGGQ